MVVKDKPGNTESSDNYRSITLSSIILKVFHWVVILHFGKSQNLNTSQFSYQKHCRHQLFPKKLQLSIHNINEHGQKHGQKQIIQEIPSQKSTSYFYLSSYSDVYHTNS